MGPPDFCSFLDRFRHGDPEAAAEFVRRYAPYIRTVVRLRLTDERLRRAFDSVDVCQSVIAEFIKRAAAGEFEVGDSRQLQALLARMAVNKFLDKVRAEKHHGGGLPDGWEPAADDETPSQCLLRQDLVEDVRRRLTERERRLWELRAAGLSWGEIATRTGEAPDALRIHFARAVARVQAALRSEEARDGR